MSLNLSSFLNESIIKSEIESLNSDYSSLVALKFSIENIEGVSSREFESIKRVLQVMYELLECNPFLSIENEFLIFLKNKDVFEANRFAKDLDMKIASLMLDTQLVTRFDITEVYKDDDIESLFGRLNGDLINIDIDEVKRDSNEPTSDDILNRLNTIFNKFKIIKIHNFYKGVNIFRDVEILSLEGSKLTLKSDKTRAMILQKEKFTFIKHDLLPKVVKAYIESVDVENSIVVLDRFEYLDSSPVARKFIRVEPKEPILINFQDIRDNKIFKAKVLNLSIKSIAIETKEFLHTTTGTIYLLKFQIPNIKGQKQLITLKGKIFSIKLKKVVFQISPGKLIEAKMLEYITNRQKELVKELKNRIS